MNGPDAILLKHCSTYVSLYPCFSRAQVQQVQLVRLGLIQSSADK